MAEKTVGPFTDYLFLPGKECKKLVKQVSLGVHCYQYIFDNMVFYAPSHHISQFYDFLYLNALLEPENQRVRERLLKDGYAGFSDLATKSLNCQARSAAIFIGLVEAGRISEVREYHSYLRLFRTSMDGKAVGTASYERVQLLCKDKVKLLSPIVPCKFNREAVEFFYAKHCSMLTNRKEQDNFLDLRADTEDGN